MKKSLLLAALVFLAACGSARRPAPKGAPSSPAPIAPPGLAPSALPAPAAPALRVGLVSDQTEFLLPGRGTPWTVLSGMQTVVIRGPVAIRPLGGSAKSRVQVGAFSEETSAEQLADKLSKSSGLSPSIVFSAEKGLYLVRLGEFAEPAAAAQAARKLAEGGGTTLVVTDPGASTGLVVRDESGTEKTFTATELEIIPPDASTFVEAHGNRYRGRLRILVNRRGSLNVVNLVNVEDYLRGVVPAEMGPKRFDEIESLKAQAVAARTYALASRGGFESEGYDLCATPKCQVYSGVGVEDALSDVAVEQTRGLVVTSGGKPIHALFTSTCGGHTEDVARIFPSMTDPALVGVVCGEQEKSLLEGAPRPRHERPVSLSLLEWRGEVLARNSGSRRRPAGRREIWMAGLALAGLPRTEPPAGLAASAVLPAVVSAFHFDPTKAPDLTDLDRSYDAGPPDPLRNLAPAARQAYEVFLRWKLAGDTVLPAPEAKISDLELGGILFSAALRLGGIQEVSGRFARRDGGHVIVKTASGPVTLDADASLWLARKMGGRFYPASEIALRSGDPVLLWRRGTKVLGFAVEYAPGGATYENQSAWTEWVRRFSARELMIRIAARTPGTEVRDITVKNRSSSGRVLQAAIVTDRSQLLLNGFELRQALELPELIFTVQKASAPDGSPEFVFVGRGWGHGVGLCQNGAYGMALSGSKFDEILRHYYTGIEIAPWAPSM